MLHPQSDAFAVLPGEPAIHELLEAWGDPVDPLSYLRDDPTFQTPQSPVSLVSDRTGGRLCPIFETEQQLAAIRGQARVLASATPVALSALQNLSNYVFGSGFTYTVRAEPGETVSAELVRSVQRVLDEFLDHNDWVGDREREVHRRAVRDGECFVALFPKPTGRVAVRFVDPEQVSAPADSRQLEDWLGETNPSSWTFGVHTAQDDVERVHGYHVRWNESGSDFDYLRAEQVEHLKLNVDRNIKRGLSDFYGILQDLLREARLRRNCAEGAALQAAIAWVQELPQGITEASATGLVSGKATSAYRQPNMFGTRTNYVQQFNPGTILRLPAGSRYISGPLGADRNPNFLIIAQYLLRSIGLRWCMPEYMISGDASNANYASTLVAESPFTKAREAEQRVYVRYFQRLLWKMLALAVRTGHLSADYAQLERQLEIVIEPPTVATRDRLKEAQFRQIESTAGILSQRTWAGETGRDYDAERRNIADEKM